MTFMRCAAARKPLWQLMARSMHASLRCPTVRQEVAANGEWRLLIAPCAGHADPDGCGEARSI